MKRTALARAQRRVQMIRAIPLLFGAVIFVAAGILAAVK